MAPEDRAPSSLLERARFVVKPGSWPKILVPCVLGIAIGLVERSSGVGHLVRTGPRIAIGVLYTVFDLVFVVLLNDYFDRDVDAIKRAMFPTTSKKTIPDGVAPARALLVLGVLAGVLAIATAFAGQVFLGLPYLGPLGVLGLAIFVAYSLPPVRLNYRGGGELLEALGIGVFLPWFDAYVVAGSVFPRAAVVIPGVAYLAFASALASGLADELSDRRGGKRTFTTIFGNEAVRRAIFYALVFGTFALALGPLFARGRIAVWVGLPAAALLVHAIPRIEAAGEDAVTNAFAAQSVYKSLLHRACGRACLVLAALLLVSLRLR